MILVEEHFARLVAWKHEAYERALKEIEGTSAYEGRSPRAGQEVDRAHGVMIAALEKVLAELIRTSTSS